MWLWFTVWVLPALWTLYWAHRAWPRKPKGLSLTDRADIITLISRVPNSEERRWLTWHWKLATEEGTDYVFQAMPMPPRWQEPEPAPRKVDPVPSSWRAEERTLTDIYLFNNPERIKSEAKSNGGRPRPHLNWRDSVYRSSNPHR